MTDTSTVTLSDFLLARIADDEEAARAATAGPWETQTMAGNLVYGNPEVGDFVCDTGAVASERVLDDALHIARHDPARVLADCDAKRRIVALHSVASSWPECAVCAHEEDYDEDSEGTFHYYRTAFGYPCPTLRLLALPYADHPDYQPEWKP